MGAEIEDRLRHGYEPQYPTQLILVKISTSQFFMNSANFNPDSYPGWTIRYLDYTQEDGTIIKYPSVSIEKNFLVSTL
ncbi:hypothetical protein IM40_06425 [Candidatus Paracaedimonas acanthamoebae]|nr:hypothetical protein IM40_06425 [Candidatus Paracaedimonas acanthamoebae]